MPNTRWRLKTKLGEGGFGEVWLGRHQTMKERRVFKFCFRADRVRSLKREMTLFRLIKERIGDHPNIVGLREVYFDRQKTAFFGFSWGGAMGTIIPAVEPRIKANILFLGGFDDGHVVQPEAQGLNYISRIKIPTLMLNSKHGMFLPLETAVRPAFNLLGTPERTRG